MTLDDLLAGTLLSPRTCRHCGHPPDDFEDEDTIVDDGPREDKPREAIERVRLSYAMRTVELSTRAIGRRSACSCTAARTSSWSSTPYET